MNIRFFVIALFFCYVCHASEKSVQGKQPFSCPYCFRLFSFRSNAIRHRKNEHEGFRYQCTLCGCRIKDSRASRDHVCKVHKVDWSRAHRYLVRGRVGPNGVMYQAKQCESLVSARKCLREQRAACKRAQGLMAVRERPTLNVVQGVPEKSRGNGHIAFKEIIDAINVVDVVHAMLDLSKMSSS